MKKRLAPVSVLVLSVTLAGCPQKTAVWVATGPNNSAVVLNFGRERGRPEEVTIGKVVVSACSDSTANNTIGATVWYIRASDSPVRLTRLRYGEVPGGFRSEFGPAPLFRGCYTIAISGTGRTKFRIASNGAIVDEGWGR